MQNEKIITIDDKLEIGPIIGFLILIACVLTGTIAWQFILIYFFFGLGDSVTLNWRKLLRKPPTS